MEAWPAADHRLHQNAARHRDHLPQSRSCIAAPAVPAACVCWPTAGCRVGWRSWARCTAAWGAGWQAVRPAIAPALRCPDRGHPWGWTASEPVPAAAPARWLDRRVLPPARCHQARSVRAPAGQSLAVSRWSPECLRHAPACHVPRPAGPALSAGWAALRWHRTANVYCLAAWSAGQPWPAPVHPAGWQKGSRQPAKSCPDGSGKETVHEWASPEALQTWG